MVVRVAAGMGQRRPLLCLTFLYRCRLYSIYIGNCEEE